jgi:NADPH:quinone reductase-like Zn-dependent oxidoreductase
MAPTTMRVIAQDEFGGPEVLHIAERPVPEPLPTEVRVRVQAAGVNPVDWKTRAGRGMAGVLGDPPFTVGWDVAGVVDAVGLGVTRFAEGDRVLGMPWFPRQAAAYAEYVTAPSRQFAKIADAVETVTAGATPLAALTAWQVLVDTADVQPGQRVLVHAAAGGVGHLAVQIAKARGATVLGTASAAKHELLTGLGLDEPIDYTSVAFEDVVRDVDVVVDLIGGEYAHRSLRTLRPGGLLVSVPSGVPEGLPEAAREAGVRATPFLVEPDGAALTGIARLLAEGTLRVLVDSTYPLERAADAHAAGEQGHNTGKLVLTG